MLLFLNYLFTFLVPTTEPSTHTTLTPGEQSGHSREEESTTEEEKSDGPFVNWEISIFSLLVVSLCFNVLSAILLAFLFLTKKRKSQPQKQPIENRVKSYDNSAV